MLDIKQLREEPDRVAKLLLKKGFNFDAHEFKQMDEDRKSLQTRVESLRNERNVKSRLIGQAKASGENIKPLVQEVGDLGDRLTSLNAEYLNIQEKITVQLESIPNIPDETVPEGKTEDENIEIRRWGEIPSFEFSAKDHVDIGGKRLLDLEAATRITGARFSVLRGPLAQLQRSLTQFMMDTHTREQGYEELYVPYMVNRSSLRATGQLPKFEEDLFAVSGEEGYMLIPTAEVPVTNMVRDRIIETDELPMKFVCHSPCFRSEAGSYGRDTRGIIRQHQFEKVELVHVVQPKESWDSLEELTSNAEVILQKLDLPYRAVVLCGGDLGFASAKTIDLEVWLPGQKSYREISSCSNFLDFQARRAQARWRNPELTKPELVHTLNGSALAVGRTLVAIMENYQDEEGKVIVPDVLRPYMGGVEEIDFSEG